MNVFSLSILGWVSACSSAIFAQVPTPVKVPPHLDKGTWETGFFTGASYGSGESQTTGGGRVMGGANLAFSVSKYVMPYAEFSYFPSIARELVTPPQAVASASVSFRIDQPSIVDFHGGVHLRIPVREFPIVPYLVGGLGIINTFSSTKYTTFQTGTQTLTTPSLLPSEKAFAVNGGGGLRWYLGGSERFGLRVEAKIYKPASGAIYTNSVFGKVEGGFFFQFYSRQR